MSEEQNEIRPLPNHVVIIPDGNRRWATDHGMKPWEGHEAGAKNTEELIRKAHSMGIRHLSIWGSSVENLKKRPLAETKALLDIYTRYFTKLAENEDIHRDRARIDCIGRWEEQFPDSLKKILTKCIENTKEYDSCFLHFCLAYSGDDEMLSAMRAVAKEYGDRPEDIDAIVLKQHLMTKDIPPVDLMIRTGGEPHLSAGFMMWDMANAQLFFSETYYPDFGSEAFEGAIADYRNRGRRYGK